MAKPVTFQGEEFEEVRGEAVSATQWLVDSYEKLGKPEDPFSEQGEHMLNMIVNAWEMLDPKAAKERRESIKDYKDNEMSISEQNKQETGRNLASIPTPVYHLMKKFFPQFKLDDRDAFMKLCKKYPYFQVANKL